MCFSIDLCAQFHAFPKNYYVTLGDNHYPLEENCWNTRGSLTLDLKTPLGGPIGSQTTSNNNEWPCEHWGGIIGHK